MDAFKLMKELRANYEQEGHYIPKETGLNLIESTSQNGGGISAKCRDAQVEDLWGLSSFFAYSTQTFVLAVNLLDRFLALMRVQPKHLSCVGLSCLHLAAQRSTLDSTLSSGHELIRIGQRRFTASDLSRMEKIVAEKLHLTASAVTPLTFLHLYHQVALSQSPSSRKEVLSLDKLEAQLKACLCRMSFSKAKPSVLALALLRHEIQAVQSDDMLEMTHHVQRHLKIADGELEHWGECVARCLSDYESPRCSRPNHRKLLWVVSRRTAHNLQTSSCCAPDLPTIPEAGWDHSQSEDLSEDLSSGEESLSSSLEGPGGYFPLHLRRRR
ncbi:hypothetical protein NHX12_027233 [Muraenolepis orangiensis]|uniref:Cyclin-like domain-containing protein n=1 Tax=Muraenolepis orangiensis TaxID=630683 RepID=A0A9Q0EF19_9TELE|nr:hypothetical protein NHX12_027233 [Muraenolepis orangiensis]